MQVKEFIDSTLSHLQVLNQILTTQPQPNICKHNAGSSITKPQCVWFKYIFSNVFISFFVQQYTTLGVCACMLCIHDVNSFRHNRSLVCPPRHSCWWWWWKNVRIVVEWTNERTNDERIMLCARFDGYSSSLMQCVICLIRVAHTMCVGCSHTKNNIKSIAANDYYATYTYDWTRREMPE